MEVLVNASLLENRRRPSVAAAPPQLLFAGRLDLDSGRTAVLASRRRIVRQPERGRHASAVPTQKGNFLVSTNFFSWLREGVKQSVLLGMSDAIESLGTPSDPKSINPQMLAFLKSSKNAGADGGDLPKIAGQSAASRKRLGKSLKEIGPQPPSSH